MAADGWYTSTGGEGEVIPPGVTRVRIHESLTVIPSRAFHRNPNIKVVECHDRIKTVKEGAFDNCRSLRKVIMPGVEVVENEAFADCKALAIVECDKLERIGRKAFHRCKSLRSINLPSAKTVGSFVFCDCHALTNVVFGKELELIGQWAFYRCTSLERITIPLKDDIITDSDSTFARCKNLKHVDLVEGELHGTIAALLLEEWKHDIYEEINSINQSLPTVDWSDDGGKARAIRMWIRSILRKTIHYNAQHRSYLNETAAILKLDLPQDIVMKNVLPFLELPSYTFEVGDHEDEEDDSNNEDDDDDIDDDESSY
eukprot:scaffold35344_cov155-Skeletonema_dohrnii-CCMP3373.AAC.1